MAKEKVSEWSSTPGSNTEISGINISEGCAPSGINDAIREVMAQIKDWQAGVSGDPSVLSQGVMENLASAATTDIGAQNTNFLRITGNTTITSFGANFKGPRFLVFEGAVTLTNSSTLVLPGGANITTAAGDVLIAIPGATLGTADKWIVTSYQKANTAPGYANMPGGFGFRNRIINGDMRIDQRNNGAAVTPSGISPFYTVDRFFAVSSQATSRFTAQQNAGSVTPPTGFKNYLGCTVTSVATLASTDEFMVAQRVEGFNIADFGWGSASAQTVTLSFWVRSSLTGNFGVSVRNVDGTRSYPVLYSISSANTWEYKTITIPGETTGTWGATNGSGLSVSWGLGIGASASGTSGAWASSNFPGVTGAVSVVGTNGATFYITGVQLEAGTVATPFERRDYGRELMMCQRYYWQGDISNGVAYFYGLSADGMGPTCSFPVTMRAAPSSASIVTAPIYENCTSFDVTWNANGLTHRLNASTGGPKAYRANGGTYSANAEL